MCNIFKGYSYGDLDAAPEVKKTGNTWVYCLESTQEKFINFLVDIKKIKREEIASEKLSNQSRKANENRASKDGESYWMNTVQKSLEEVESIINDYLIFIRKNNA
jgi:uncharacterized protein (UPF0305 family)